MKRFHISISVEDFSASMRDYSARLGAVPCVVKDGRYALWRTDLLNFSISRKPGQPAGQVRHIGFEDDAEPGFREETDANGIMWEYFSAAAQQHEIEEKIMNTPPPLGGRLGGGQSCTTDCLHPNPLPEGEGNIEYRLLSEDDGEAFFALRLRAVQEEPSAFLETYEEVKAMEKTPFSRYLDHGWIAGAFSGGELAGISGLYRHKGVKTRHKGTVWGVYVAPEMRGRGVARRLLGMLLHEARQAGLELVHLSTDAANAASQALYRSLGFTPWGIEPQLLKLPERYVDDMWMSKQLADA